MARASFDVRIALALVGMLTCIGCAGTSTQLATVKPEPQAAPTPEPAAVESKPAVSSCTRNAAGADVCSYDYAWHGKHVEAMLVKPRSEAPVPGLLLLPGTGRTARDLQHMAEAFARNGFACLAISLPGYGQTEVEPDFAGPNTLDMLQTMFEHFQREPFVDPHKLGVFGYSLGAITASLLVLRLPAVRAAVFGGGVYDLAKAYAEVKFPAIRAHIDMEVEVTEASMRERSSVLQMEKLQCPVLIVHGELDDHAQVNQAYLLRDRLQALGKEYELKIVAGQGHTLPPQEIALPTLEFFKRKLLQP